MMVAVDGQKVHFTQVGGGDNVLLLHGWGADGQSLSLVAQHLARHLRVTVPDLPGFGKTSAPQTAWGTAEYAQFVRAFLGQLAIGRTHVIAHSFGGRIALYLAAKWPEGVGRLVLVDSAGIRLPRTARYYLTVGAFKALRNLFKLPLWGPLGSRVVDSMSRRLGSKDYREASGTMRGTLVRVVNEDLRHLLPSVTAPTLIIWGSDDAATPVENGQLMAKLVPQARLIIFPGAGHFSYLDRLPQFLRTLDSFLNLVVPEGVEGAR
jgi:pimeloyl-ACP methyl ester carboxylesterase